MENKIFSESYKNKYEHYAHSVGTLMFHLQWCMKYRYKMARKEENAKLLDVCVRRSASKNGIKIIELNVQPEHVHCIVLVKFDMSVSRVLQLLKGGSAYLYSRHQEKARFRYPQGHFWSKGKFTSMVGFVEFSVVQNYVRNQ